MIMAFVKISTLAGLASSVYRWAVRQHYFLIGHLTCADNMLSTFEERAWMTWYSPLGFPGVSWTSILRISLPM